LVGFGFGLSLPLLVEPPGVVELVLEPDELRPELVLELEPELVSGEVAEVLEPRAPALLAPLSMLSQAASAPPMARIRAAVERVLRAIRSLLRDGSPQANRAAAGLFRIHLKCCPA
jgi:hypothetical protein